MNRIAIVGCPGSGKSTLSRQLAELYDLPLVHFDQLHWAPGWVERSVEETADRIDAAVAEDRWVTDGNYTAYSEERLRRADLVVWLDHPRRVCLRRIAKRVWTESGKVRPDMGEGCPERFDASFVRWVWDWKRTHRPGVLDRMLNSPTAWVWLRHPRHTARWLEAQRLSTSLRPPRSPSSRARSQ